MPYSCGCSGDRATAKQRLYIVGRSAGTACGARIVKYYLANKQPDSEWVVLPVTNFAYFGTSSFSKVWLGKLPETVIQRSNGFGCCRYKTPAFAMQPYVDSVENLVNEAIAQFNIGEKSIFYVKKEASSLVGAGVSFPEQLRAKMLTSPIIAQFNEKVNMNVASAEQSKCCIC